jgi:hypothetical protein
MNTLEIIFTFIAIIISIYLPLWLNSQRNKKEQFKVLLDKVGVISDGVLLSKRDIKVNAKGIEDNKTDIENIQGKQELQGLDIKELQTKIL